MSKIFENPIWESSVYQIDTEDSLIGGTASFDANGEATASFLNAGVQQVTNRTAYLKNAQDVDIANLTSHIGSRGAAHTNATTTEAGFMSAADKAKLNGVADNAQVNTVTSVATRTGAVVLTKVDVGLTNVDNTADTTKPVSTAQQTALNLKANLASPALTGTPTTPTAAAGTNTAQVASTAFVTTAVASVAPQNTFSTVAVSGQTSVVADTTADTLTFIAGTNVTITTDATNDTITINSTASGSGGGGLTNFTESVSTTAPNATVPVVVLTATNAATNVDVVLAPKGAGALMLDIPDATTAGGNKRGAYAIDFQSVRNDATQVASGNYSTIIGGQLNTAGGISSIAGGNRNSASGNYAVALGTNNTASGAQSVALGNSNQASGEASVCLGYTNGTNNTFSIALGAANSSSGQASFAAGSSNTITSTAVAAIAMGQLNRADSAYSFASGYQAVSRALVGAEARANGMFLVQGDAQRRRALLRATTTTTAATVLTTNAAAATSSNIFVLPDNSTYKFHGSIVARNTSGLCSSWTVSGLVNRISGVASTVIVGTPVITLDAQSSGTSAWTVSLSANTTLGGLAVSVVGPASAVNWVADITTIELVG